ncbi:adenylate/guanylate cyclase domain-containing protein [Sulfurimonas sp.]|jgi:adenylate cyclase|uniref:adenylate/guanylate cyclase domain-containing protein n=1 Tax=Sulfurimonas sp. TaxID=2022749 RepID=UPI0025D06436|nr:adenylate/guanylate cyclase domain-containing protein [Sulfurimonas sp.]MBT5934628.1 adenylate/guanylate cyclase domain-containing protein [Sulfurimonas sp.]
MKEKLLYFLALIPILTILLLLQHYKVDPLESFSLKFNDVNFNVQEKDPSKDVVFVAVDEPSVNEYGRWPWKREKLAIGMDNLVQADVVLLDMIFSEPTSEEQDSMLAESISSLNNSVCGFFLRHKATQNIGDDELEILGDSSLDLLQSQIMEYEAPKFASATFAEMNILPILEACTLSGSFSTVRAKDDKLRAYPISMYFKNILYPSLGIQGLRIKFNKDIQRIDNKHLELNNKLISLTDDGLVRLNYYDINKYKTISFLDVATGVVKPEYFKNKIVILGITEVGAGDIVSTPIGSIPGPLLHYTFMSNLLQDHLIEEFNYISTILVILMALMPFILVLLIKKIVYRAIANIVIYTILYIYVRYLFVEYMMYIDMFYPLITLILSLIGVEAIAFNIQERSGKFIRGAFSSYLSGDLLDQLIENPKALSLGGERKELSMLFSDIRGFTTISESMDPISLITLLNRYFTPMTNVVMDNHGMLDKYIGDAVMAFYNAPVDVKDHADAACKSALEMIVKLDELNIELNKENIPSIYIGIGINTAEVVVGNMGSDSRFNYTVIGDGVNLASRVESLTKNYGVNILITEFTVQKISKDFIYRKIEPVKVKGKDQAVLLYELMAFSEESKTIQKLYTDALDIYINGDLDTALKLFETLVEKYDDNPSKYFITRIEEKHPWGVNIMKTK